jgi:Carboxypeptidase regulatory-like domain
VSRRRKRLTLLTALFVLLCAVQVPCAIAQVSKGSISGTLLDPQKAVVARADVSVTNTATNERFNAITDSAGFFQANLLPVGTYRVEISNSGFKKLLVEQVRVNAGSDHGLGTLQLAVGEITTTLEVAATSRLIESTQAQVSSSFGRETLTTFSGLLENNGLDNLALTVPGVVNSGDLAFSNINGAGFAVNGLRGRSNDQQIDGQNNNDNLAEGPSLALSDPEFVEEYQIITSNFDPAYGRNSGSVVNILTKSGTNSLHGSLYATEGNWRFNALSSNQKAFEGLTQVPTFNDAFLGATIGGAAIKDKLFFFGGVNAELTNRVGVFSAGQLTPTPAGVAALAQCLPDSNSVKALETYGPYSVKAGNPTPQGPVVAMDIANCRGVDMAGIQRILPADFRQHDFVVKLDYKTAQNYFYGRYIFGRNNLYNGSGNVAGGYPFDTLLFSQDYAFSWTRFISTQTANEFRASYGRLNDQDGGNSIGNTVPRAAQLGNALTTILFNDPAILSLGVPLGSPLGRIVNTYQIQDNWTHIAGRHSLKAGVNFTHLRSPNIGLTEYNGLFRYGDLGAFVANTPGRVQLASGNPYLDFRESDTFLYLGDDFKLSPNFILNLGLTWSYYGQPANLLHRLTTQLQTSSNPLWNPSLPLSATTFPAFPAPKNSWGPGVGFAWSPGKGLFNSTAGKTVIRGGYRLAYDPPFYNIYTKMAGGAPSVVLTTLTGANASVNPLPAVPTGTNVRTLLAPHLQTGIFDPRTLGETTISPHFSPDRVHQWSLGVQVQIAQNAAFEVRYVGNHAQNLFQTINGNPYILGLANLYPQLVPAGLTPCPASEAAIPELIGRVNCTGAALIRERTNTGYSDYHGLQTEFRTTHLWNQLILKSAYTFSKDTDNASEIGATLAAGGTFAISQSQVNFTDQEHSLSGLDFPQNWVLTVLEDLPFYRHQSGFLSHALGGWKVSAVYSLYSGQPFTAAQSGLNCASGGGACGGIPDAEDPYDPAFNAALGGPDGSLRPFLGNSAAPVQSVGVFANDICAVDVAGNLCGSSTITPTTLISLNRFNNGFTGTMTDAAGNTVPDPAHAPSVVLKNQVRFIANTRTADQIFDSPFGNVGRNTLRTSKTNVLNLSIFKITNISEKFSLQFHADFLNALNHPNFASIDPFIDNAGRVAEGLGFANPKVEGTGSRSIWFGLKLLF